MPHDSSHVRTLDQVLHATRAFCSRIFFYPAFYVLLSNNREPYTRSRIDLIYVSTASAITECVLSTLSLTDYLTAWTRMIVIIYVS